MEISKRIAAAAGVIVAMSCGMEAKATVIYDAAGTYLINSTINDNVVSEHADAKVVVGSGGVVRGAGATEFGWHAGAIKAVQGSLEVIGNGRVIAGSGQSAISLAGPSTVVTLRDRASITGDVSSFMPGMGSESNGLARLLIQDQVVLNGNLNYGGYVRIQDQALILGNLRGNHATTNLNLDFRGGTIVGSVQVAGLDDHSIVLTGGSILGGVFGGPSLVQMTMTDGYIGEGVHTRGSLQATFSGGQIDGGISVTPDSIDSSALSITGGIFDTHGTDWLLEFADSRNHTPSTRLSTLDISGGQFGYSNAGAGFFIDEWVSFNIFGRDLVYSGGWLSGYLMDGNWFNNQLTFGSNWRGAFTIHNVPEPGTSGLLVVGFVGMLVGRRRSAASGSVD